MPVKRKKQSISKLTKLPSLSVKIRPNYTRIPFKKEVINRPWSKWKHNRSDGTEFLYTDLNQVNLSPYPLSEMCSPKTDKKLNLQQILKRKMDNDKSYRE